MVNVNIKRVFEFFYLLRLEPFIFLFMFYFSIKRVPLDQLIQDKICVNKYNLDQHYCKILPEMTKEDDFLHKKSAILGDATQFILYSTVLTTIPAVVASLFLGGWVDNYVNAKKCLLIISGISGIIEGIIIIVNAYFFSLSHYWLLLAYVPSSVSGGMMATFTAIWSYIASTTPPKLRAMRMLVAELAIFTAQPLGTFIGGKILNTNSMLSSGQLHNYSMVFIVGCVILIASLLWSTFMINEKKEIIEFRLRFNRTTDLEMNNIRKNADQSDTNSNVKDKNAIQLLFDINNVKEMFKTCLKKRDNHIRLQIWLLFLSMIGYLMCHLGPFIFLFQFTQKIYAWNSEKYSNITALGNIVNALVTLTIAPILIKVMKTKDTILAMIGLAAYFGQNMIRGTVLTENGFYISILVGALGSVTSVGIRTHFSKIVEHKELGKVFSLMSAIDSVAPLIASAVFTTVFRATMDSMPGICFIITGAFLVPPFLIMIWIDVYTVLPKDIKNPKVETDKEVYAVDSKL